MIKIDTCIVCPMGCELELDTEKMLVRGNGCPRGEQYAKTEYTAPMRIVTSTVKCEFGDPIPVKTDRPIPKKKVHECMKIINGLLISDDVTVGDVLKKGVFGSNIVATANWRRDK
ncbi:MAG: DUF1667 domain-containing protein [Ruminococcaceae bacterium]|nr:DUF1667 domain-containing protein [Oscillospiraceae bacterium]